MHRWSGIGLGLISNQTKGFQPEQQPPGSGRWTRSSNILKRSRGGAWRSISSDWSFIAVGSGFRAKGMPETEPLQGKPYRCLNTRWFLQCPLWLGPLPWKTGQDHEDFPDVSNIQDLCSPFPSHMAKTLRFKWRRQEHKSLKWLYNCMASNLQYSLPEV